MFWGSGRESIVQIPQSMVKKIREGIRTFFSESAESEIGESVGGKWEVPRKLKRVGSGRKNFPMGPKKVRGIGRLYRKS